jgi:hypothetical protein
VGQALATEAIAECIRSGGVREAESNVEWGCAPRRFGRQLIHIVALAVPAWVSAAVVGLPARFDAAVTAAITSRIVSKITQQYQLIGVLSCCQGNAVG